MALMMAAVRTSETLVYFNETTRRYIPEAYCLQSLSFIGKVQAKFFYRTCYVGEIEDP
jgi:hypothetical protein